jgi:hypothetical protein
VRALGEPRRKALAGLSWRLGGGYSAGVEAERARLGAKGR